MVIAAFACSPRGPTASLSVGGVAPYGHLLNIKLACSPGDGEFLQIEYGQSQHRRFPGNKHCSQRTRGICDRYRNPRNLGNLSRPCSTVHPATNNGTSGCHCEKEPEHSGCHAATNAIPSSTDHGASHCVCRHAGDPRFQHCNFLFPLLRFVTDVTRHWL